MYVCVYLEANLIILAGVMAGVEWNVDEKDGTTWKLIPTFDSL